MRPEKAERAEAAGSESRFHPRKEHVMKAFVIGISILALGLAGCMGDQPRNQTGGSASTEVKQDTKNAALTAKVKSALAADVGLRTLKIDVDSMGNTVTLKGAVDSADTRRRVEEVARKVDGVATVRNELTVRSGS
jgi:osmotically-inducible protein OsmY